MQSEHFVPAFVFASVLHHAHLFIFWHPCIYIYYICICCPPYFFFPLCYPLICCVNICPLPAPCVACCSRKCSGSHAVRCPSTPSTQHWSRRGWRYRLVPRTLHVTATLDWQDVYSFLTMTLSLSSFGFRLLGNSVKARTWYNQLLSVHLLPWKIKRDLEIILWGQTLIQSI